MLPFELPQQVPIHTGLANKPLLEQYHSMSEFSYIRCRWKHDFQAEPIDIWSEITNEGYEERKLEYFRDGTIGYASSEKTTKATTGTILADQKLPSIDESANDPEFELEQVTKADFEARWTAVLWDQ